MKIEHIKQRAILTKIIREFFNEREYLELETPLLSPTLIPESTIEVFKTEHTHPFKNIKESYLIPSPEIWLKRFLSKNPINIFEISKCFRNSEQSGSNHNPEFSMIEYYTMGFTHLDTLELTKSLLKYINTRFKKSQLPKKFIEITMNDAFIKYAGFSLELNGTIELLHKQAKKLNIPSDINDDWETAFNRIFIDIVEPNFPKDVNLFLTHFPSKIKTLAKTITNTPWAQRWELYIKGIECGNCYTEETNPKLIREFFLEEKIYKKDSLIDHKIDIEYFELFRSFPECSGGAIGIDRLIMAILGIDKIQGVILFPYHDNI